MKKPAMMATIATAPTAIPAFAPVERPLLLEPPALDDAGVPATGVDVAVNVGFDSVCTASVFWLLLVDSLL